MWLKKVIFLTVLVSINVFCLKTNKKNEERKIGCKECIKTKNASCIAEMCDYEEYKLPTQDMKKTIAENAMELQRSNQQLLMPPVLRCQDDTILVFTWNATANTEYFLEYSIKLDERSYTELTSNGSTIVKGLRSGQIYTIQMTSISYGGNQIILRRSPPVTARTLEIDTTPLPVANVYMYALTLKNGKYNAIIKWLPAPDKSCYYEVVWFSGDESEDYKQADITNPLSLYQMNISELNFGRNYSLAIRAVNEGIKYRRESSEEWLVINVPTCLETYNSLEKCVPEPPENFTVEEDFVRVSLEAKYLLYDVRMSWSKAKFTPNFYTAHLFDQTRNSSAHLNITGDSTTATFKNMELGSYYHISLIAYSKKGPSSPTTIYRYVNGTAAAIASSNSWSGTEIIVIVVCSLIILGLAFLLVLNHYLTKKVRENYFKELGENIPPTVTYIINGTNKQGEPDKWEIQPENLLMKDILGEGAFGVVRRGSFSIENEKTVDVAIKMLRTKPTQEELMQFYQEIDIMKSVPPHPHLVSLIGCITRETTNGSGPLLVVEYCSKGDLQTYLRSIWDKLTNSSVMERSYTSDSTVCASLKTVVDASSETTEYASNKLYDYEMDPTETDLPQSKDLISFARQIVLGMEYLSSLKLIHRDLAARNILVCENNIVKISDFGLSRDVYHNKVYCKTSGGKLPIRWMALESITHQVYTIQSDIWSFGILLWEIVTLGSTPYPGISTPDLLNLLKDGYRMEKPSNCSDELYEIMRNCWKTSPRERPTFREVRNVLEVLLEQTSGYLNLNIDESTDIYLFRTGDVGTYNDDFSHGFEIPFKGI